METQKRKSQNVKNHNKKNKSKNGKAKMQTAKQEKANAKTNEKANPFLRGNPFFLRPPPRNFL